MTHPNVKQAVIDDCLLEETSETPIPYNPIGMYHGVSTSSVKRWWLRWNDMVIAQDPRPGCNRWFIYDSKKAALVGAAYRSEADAQQAVYHYL